MTSRYFTAFCHPSDSQPAAARFGFTTPRALGKAVLRNRLKRRMRAAIQRLYSEAPVGWSIVFNPRPAAASAAFEELCREIGRVFERCKQS